MLAPSQAKEISIFCFCIQAIASFLSSHEHVVGTLFKHNTDSTPVMCSLLFTVREVTRG